MKARWLIVPLFAVALYMGDRVMAGIVQCEAAQTCPNSGGAK
ncbi:hypothetical protein [Novosphingobium sp.]|nr:hypothetical protein [Novosphingobium sp.]